MTLLVSADAACWIPIILLGIASLANLKISPKVKVEMMIITTDTHQHSIFSQDTFFFCLQIYAWIAVFVLPLNAALNPVLYTISSTLPSLIARFKGKKGPLSYLTTTTTERRTSSSIMEMELNEVSKDM